MLKAQHIHDCDICTLIANLSETDLYYCDEEQTVVARRSAEGPDYDSFPLCVARHAAKSSVDWDLRVRLADAFLAGRTSASG